MNLLFLGTWEIILIVLVVLLLFGGKKIPELMKGLGKGVKSFKDGMNGLEAPQGSQPTDKPSNSAKEDSSRDNTNQES